MMHSPKNIVAFLILVVLAVFVSADDISAINTPPTLIQNQIYQITWTYTGPPANKGQLIITNSGTNTPKLISAAVPLQPNAFAWTVDVDPGKYFFSLTEAGTATTKTSGAFQVVANDGTTPPGANSTVPATPVSTSGIAAPTATSATTTGTTKPTAPAGSGSSAPANPPNDGSKPASSIFVTVLLPLVFALVQMI